MKLLMPAISGLFSAASMNLDVLAARNFSPIPWRSSSRKVTSPDVPTPGRGGGGTTYATPEEISAFSLLFRRAAMPSAVMPGAVRSDQGFREMKKKELDELWTELMRLKPFTVVTTSTPGSSLMIFSIRAAVSAVTFRDVLSGSSTPPNR